MPSNPIEAHRPAIGNFNNTQSSPANGAIPPRIFYGNLTSVDNEPRDLSREIFDLPAVDYDQLNLEFNTGKLPVLKPTSLVQLGALLLYVHNGLAPGAESPLLIGADAQNDTMPGDVSRYLDSTSSGHSYLMPVPAYVADTGNRETPNTSPFIGVGAQSDTPLIPPSAKQSRSIATYLGQLGNSLMSAGALGCVRQDPGHTAAKILVAGLGLVAVGTGLSALSGGSTSAPRMIDVRQRLATLKQPDGETLDRAVSNAIHGCAGNGSCERDAVATVLGPYKEQLGYVGSSDAEPFSGVSAAGIPGAGLDWNGYIDSLVNAYNLWDEQSLLSDIEVISRAPTNDDRRRAIVDMLEERGFSPQARFFSVEPPRWFSRGTDVSGTNIVADITSPESNAQAPVLLLAAHLDKIGEGSQGAYDNGSGCAVVLELARRLQEWPPENCQIKMAFFDEEETGLNGSRAMVQECRDENNCPALMINIDLAASGDLIYAGSSNATHKMASLSDDSDAASVPMPEQPLETRFLDGMRAAADKTTLAVVQNKGTPGSDHLSFQFGGLPAVGISLLGEGQPEEMERVSLAAENVKTTNNAIDWNRLKPLQQEMNLASGSGNRERIANARKNYFDEARRQPFEQYIAAIEEQVHADQESTVSQAIHGANDVLALIHPRDVMKFVDVIEQGIRDFCQKLPAST